MPSGVYPRVKPIPAFLSKFKVGDGCWQWEASQYKTGYGSFKVNKRSTSAHRFSFQLFYGKIPKDLFVLHSCDNRLCVKPAHLRLGTQKENMMDCVKRGRIAYGEKQGLSILTVGEVGEIRLLHSQGMSAYRLARIYQCSDCAIDNIVNGRTWKQIY